LPACSQLALTGDTPMLIRNYDYQPELCERVVFSSAFNGRRVIGSSDCLWGLLDGMNDAELAISLAFGGRRGVGAGFAIPLIIRYVLEIAETVGEAVAVLSRVPVNMAYNLTILDRNADAANVFVAPGAEPEVFPRCLATNHRDTVPEDADHARRFRSVERQQALVALQARKPNPDAAISAFLKPPLYNTAYAAGFGTMYTAAYRPKDGVVDYVWPGSTWRRGFDSPDETHEAVYRPHLT
jgi:predicted choloylglycine hydrolase